MTDVDSLSFPGVTTKGPVFRPIIDGKLTDTFGAPRPGGRKHEGIDIFAKEGTPIHAIAGGTVVQGFGNALGGNVVRIQGDDGRFYYYAHLKDGSFDHLHVGEHVNAGQVIGGVGHTGDAAGTPNHLHLQVRQNGDWVNPFNFLQPLPELSEDPTALAAATDFSQSTGANHTTDPFAIEPGSPPSVADADHDGLVDQFEAMFGTNPNLADTDHDGLSDAFEASVSHTDPLSADTDQDGITDAHEIAEGLDPGHVAMPAAAQAANFAGQGVADSDHDGLTDAFEASQSALAQPAANDPQHDDLLHIESTDHY